MQSSTHFRFVNGDAPYVFIMDVVETEALMGEPNIYIIKPGEAFWGISFEDLAQAENGTLILLAPGRGEIIIAYNDWPTDPAEPR